MKRTKGNYARVAVIVGLVVGWLVLLKPALYYSSIPAAAATDLDTILGAISVIYILINLSIAFLIPLAGLISLIEWIRNWD